MCQLSLNNANHLSGPSKTAPNALVKKSCRKGLTSQGAQSVHREDTLNCDAQARVTAPAGHDHQLHISKEEMILPSTESVRKSPTQDVSAMTPAGTAATPGPDPVDMALPPCAPDTAATRALWAALAAHVTATVVELASTAGVSRSTANKTLAALEEAGLATRTAGAGEGTQRLPDQWQAVIQLERTMPESTEVADTTIDVGKHIEAPVSDQHEGVHRDKATEQHEAMATDLPKGASAAPPVPASIKARLGAGQLRDMVLVHLRDHSDRDHTPRHRQGPGPFLGCDCQRLREAGQRGRNRTDEREAAQVPLRRSCVANSHRTYPPKRKWAEVDRK